MKLNNISRFDIDIAWHKTTQNLKSGNLLEEVLTVKTSIYQTAKFQQINAINWNGDEVLLRGVGYIIYPYGKGNSRNYHRGEITKLEIVYNFKTGEAYQKGFASEDFALLIGVSKKEDMENKDFPPFLRNKFFQTK